MKIEGGEGEEGEEGDKIQCLTCSKDVAQLSCTTREQDSLQSELQNSILIQVRPSLVQFDPIRLAGLNITL